MLQLGYGTMGEDLSFVIVAKARSIIVVAFRRALSKSLTRLRGIKMEHCEICGKEHGNNLLWSEEWACDDCIEWIEAEERKTGKEIYQYPVREY